MGEGTTQRGTATIVHRPQRPAGSTHSSTRGLSPSEQTERQAGFPSSDKTRPDSPVPTLQGPCGRSPKRGGSLRFLPPLEVRPSSIAPNPDESREAPPNSTVPLTSQRHPEKLHEVTGTCRGNPGFLPQWEKDLESPTSTCLEARICFHGSIEMTRTPSPRIWRPDFPGAIREAP